MAPVYPQLYRKAWETLPELKDWIRSVESDNRKIYCVYCKCEISAKLSDLRKHVKAKRHNKAAEPFSSEGQRKLNFPKSSDVQNYSSSEAEGRLTMFIAVDGAFLTVNHISETCKKIFCDSKTALNIKLHRTKCKNITVNILVPHFIDIMKDCIGDAKYSLFIDESTDLAVVKILGVKIRYFSKTLQKIVSTYLGLVETES